ncbi:MAG: cytochrome b [Hyphomicrobiales bacterium]|nr:cytochrome b [Hyphomicrobiales bacterium]
MRQSRTVSNYSSLQIVLHWTIACLVLFQLVFGESMTEAVDAIEEGEATGLPTDYGWGFAHYWVGIAILALVALRISARLMHGAPAHPDHAPSWTKLGAKVSHATFYLLLGATPILGLLAYYVGDPWGDIHSLAKPVFIVLIALHVAAAFLHQFWFRDGTLSRMLSTQ